MRSKKYIIWLALLWFTIYGYGGRLKANMVYQFEIFTCNGQYYDSPDLNLYVEVSDRQANQVDFTFYNESLTDSSMARIYFDNGLFDNSLLLDTADINEGPGTLFSRSVFPGPDNLPAGNTLEPSFVTTGEFYFGAEPSPSHNGINPGEWVTITFGLTDGGTVESVIGELNSGDLRIGVHIIALLDGSSNSAIAVPEPGTLALLGIGGIMAFGRKRRTV